MTKKVGCHLWIFPWIRHRHSTWIAEKVTNSSNGFTNLEFRIYEFFSWMFVMISSSTGKLRKNVVLTNKKLIFFFNYSNWVNFVEKISETNWWKNLMNSLHDQVIFVHFQSIFFTLGALKRTKHGFPGANLEWRPRFQIFV